MLQLQAVKTSYEHPNDSSSQSSAKKTNKINLSVCTAQLTHTHLSLMHYVQSIIIKPTFLWYYLLYLPNGGTVFSVKHIYDRLCYLMVPFPVWKTTKSFPYPPHLLLFPPHYANHNTWMEKRVSVRKTKKHCILQNIYGRAANWLIHY